MTNTSEPSGYFPESTPVNATWRWRLEDDAGTEVAAPQTAPGDGPRFTAQSDAESWVGEVWRELVEEGVAQVTLFDADREVYGPMSLRA